MKRKYGVALNCAIIVILLLSFSISSVDAKRKKKVEMKTGNEQTSLMFDHVEKIFVVDETIVTPQIKKLAAIDNSSFILDTGKVPAKSLIDTIASSGKPIKIVLPNDFTNAQLKRLRNLKSWEAIFKVKSSDFTDKFVNSVLSLGITPRTFEIDHKELTNDVQRKLFKIRHYKIRLLVPEGEVVSKQLLWQLSRRKLAGQKEIVIFSDYPVKDLRKLSKFKRLKLILQARAGKFNTDQVRFANKCKKLNIGTMLRGLVKFNEAQEYMLIKNLRSIRMQIEGWEITDDFVRLMNSKGEITQ